MTWDVSNYNTNPDLNQNINAIDISEGSSADGYNDALRQMMADIKTWTDTYAVTYPIAVNKGGTGAITAVAALTNLGALAATYQYLPQTVETGAFGLPAGANGGHIRYTGGGSNCSLVTNATTPFPVGAVVLVVNDGSGALAFVPVGGVTLVWAATAATGSRSLAVGGMATLLQVAIDRWYVTGTGLS
jgi:hypothetical protein